VQQWNGKCFDDASLSKLGYIWHMGHGGQPCPQSQVLQEWEEVDEDIDMDDGARVETIEATVPGAMSEPVRSKHVGGGKALASACALRR